MKLQSLICLFVFAMIVGCGPSREGYDPSSATAVTAEEEQAAADYEAQLQAEMEEHYGKKAN